MCVFLLFVQNILVMKEVLVYVLGLYIFVDYYLCVVFIFLFGNGFCLEYVFDL